jgi:hypothetical protein
MKRAIIAILVLAVIAFFTYSVLQYKKTGADTQGLITCAEGSCYWTAHIHSFVRIQLCGKEISLPKLTGGLSGIHTHTEENILHWHDKIPVDPQTRQLQDTSVLHIGHALQTLSIPFAKDQLMEEKNGDLCPDEKAGTLKFFVDGVPISPDPAYVWSDGQIIDILFDGRTNEEALQYVQTLPKTFPSLTNG